VAPLRLHLLFVGFGHVGRRFAQLLTECRQELARLEIEPVVAGIVTSRHGAVFAKAGLDANKVAQQRAKGDAIGPASVPSALEWIARLRSQDAEAHVLVETTPLDIRSGEPAIAHVRAAFAAGAHVITANKGPAAFAYASLTREADAAGVSFLFEGAVMDGIPVFNLVRETLPAVRVDGFRGVVNSTTNEILTAMERGEAFDAALARMQVAGVAEADASLDIDGWDAAAKTAALANVLLDANLTPHAVMREGIGPGHAARCRDAVAAGRRLKLVAHATRSQDVVRAAVELQELPATDPLAIVGGQANALELDTWPTGRIVVTQRDGGLEKTAYALLSDLITVARRVRHQRGSQTHPAW
jgi:homoserine dehydrogenase